jgi:hypothetical protein
VWGGAAAIVFLGKGMGGVRMEGGGRGGRAE